MSDERTKEHAVSDERDGADAAGDDGDGGETEDGRGSRTAVVTQPQRPTGKRSRQRAVADTDEDDDAAADSGAAVTAGAGASKNGSATKTKVAKKTRSWKDPSSNPIVYVYNYLKQVVTELRKVIWPNRNQMVTYTSVVMVFLAFMVAVVAFSDLGLGRLVLLVFGSG